MPTNHSAPRTTQRLVLLTLLVAGIFLLTGCNTVAGIGEDIEAAGVAIESKAKKAKRY